MTRQPTRRLKCRRLRLQHLLLYMFSNTVTGFDSILEILTFTVAQAAKLYHTIDSVEPDCLYCSIENKNLDHWSAHDYLYPILSSKVKTDANILYLIIDSRALKNNSNLIPALLQLFGINSAIKKNFFSVRATVSFEIK